MHYYVGMHRKAYIKYSFVYLPEILGKKYSCLNLIHFTFSNYMLTTKLRMMESQKWERIRCQSMATLQEIHIDFRTTNQFRNLVLIYSCCELNLWIFMGHKHICCCCCFFFPLIIQDSVCNHVRKTKHKTIHI